MTAGTDTSLASLIGQDELCVVVYRMVISEPQWSVARISEELGVTEVRVRESLDLLAELSMLHVPGDGVSPLPVHPEVGFSAYIHRREAEIRMQQLELAAVRAATAELAATYAAHQASRSSGLERLQGVHEVRARLTEMSRRAKEELLAFMPGGALSQAALHASRPLDEQSLAAGVRLRTVYLESVRNDRPTTEYARWLSELGGEVRTAPSLPLRMLVVDRTSAVLPIDPENSQVGAAVIHSAGVVAALVALFDMVWERAVPLAESRQPSNAETPTPQEMALLDLLAQGHTDEVAARKLGLSLRTVRRMMASVSARLGARSRFEAGLLASRSGWI
jgi:DNA-binding CsgD family transcriptional regulator/sugar-specific transcriptional regulator TrmB